MDFSEVIKYRYSCKKFSDVEVKKEKLDKILEAGRSISSCKINAPQTVVKYPIVAIFHTVKSITVITYRYTMPEEKAA